MSVSSSNLAPRARRRRNVARRQVGQRQRLPAKARRTAGLRPAGGRLLPGGAAHAQERAVERQTRDAEAAAPPCRELRRLQDEVNRVIVTLQEYTANPVTDSRLGRVGR